jgi:hypothetical protein
METFIDRYARDIQFAAAIAEQNRETEQYINECLIKASGNKRAIQEMTILNESSFGDKIKSFFEKIKNFFKKIFDKFAASMTAVFSEQKEYIDKYATIVTKCKYQATDVEGTKDHFKGLPRMLDVVNNVDAAIIGSNLDKYFSNSEVPSTEGMITLSAAFPYDDAEKLLKANANPPEKISLEAIRNRAFDEFVQTGYWSGMSDFSKENDDNGNVNFEESFKVYFDGSKDDVSWDKDQIDANFQTIINTTYAGQSYLKKLEKINERINAKMTEASKKMEDYYAAQRKKITDSIDKMGDSSANVTADNKIQQVKQKDVTALSNGKFEWNGTIYDTKEKAEEAKQKAAQNDPTQKASTESYSYFTEEIHGSSGSSGTSGNNNSKDKPSGQVGKQEKETLSNASDKVSKMKAKTPEAKENSIKGVTDGEHGNKEEVMKAATNLLDNYDIWNRQSRVNADTQISSAIARSLYGSFQQLNKDFFWIIKEHVKWYLGNPGEQDKTENQRAKVSTLNMNAGSETVNKTTPVTKKSQSNDIKSRIDEKFDELYENKMADSDYKAWADANFPTEGPLFNAVKSKANL